MSQHYKKSVNYKLVELASKYSPADIIKGKVRGRGTGALRNLENRFRVASILAHNSKFVELDKAYDAAIDKEKSYYCRKIMKQPGREVERCIAMAKIELQNELMPYSSNNEIKQEVKTNYQSEDTKGYHTEDKKEALTSKNRGGSKLATAALIAALGVSSLFGSFVRGCYDEKIIREKDRRIEQIVEQNKESRMIIVTDLESKELDKKYQDYSKQEKEGRIPILNLTHSKSDNLEEKLSEIKAESKKDKEIWGNGGYLYRKDIPEFSPEELGKKERYKKIYDGFRKESWDNIKQVPKDIKRSIKGLIKAPFDLVTLNLKKFGNDFWDILGGVNHAAEHTTRGVINGTAGMTPIGILDKGVKSTDHFTSLTYDGLVGGDFDKEWKCKLFGLKWFGKNKLIDMTFKSPENFYRAVLSGGSDYYLGKLIIDKWFGGGKTEETTAVSGGNPPGRSGGGPISAIAPGRGGGPVR